MAKPNHNAVAEHRQRQKRKGLVRVEVQVPERDARAVRALSKALRDPETAPQLRSKLAALFEPESRPSFKELLRAGPDVDLDLERVRSWPRDVEL